MDELGERLEEASPLLRRLEVARLKEVPDGLEEGLAARREVDDELLGDLEELEEVVAEEESAHVEREIVAAVELEATHVLEEADHGAEHALLDPLLLLSLHAGVVGAHLLGRGLLGRWLVELCDGTEDGGERLLNLARPLLPLLAVAELDGEVDHGEKDALLLGVDPGLLLDRLMMEGEVAALDGHLNVELHDVVAQVGHDEEGLVDGHLEELEQDLVEVGADLLTSAEEHDGAVVHVDHEGHALVHVLLLGRRLEEI